MSRPTHLFFEQVDADWCRAWARQIVEELPCFEQSNSSGKFFSNYQCWHFHKDSEHPLIRKFVETLEANRECFERTYQRPMQIDFLVLSYVKDASQEICLWHKDQYFFNGQGHLTILGNANISVRDDGAHDSNDPNAPSELIRPPDGTVWYLNGSEYYHRIETTSGERFELCAPLSQLPEHVRRKKLAVVDHPYRYLDGNHPEWVKLREELILLVKNSVKRGTASNPRIASFPTDVPTGSKPDTSGRSP